MTVDSTVPADLLYHPEHDWTRVEDVTATFGISWYAQDLLGELVFWDPPALGATLAKDEEYCELESVKAVSAVVAPLSGEVLEVNAAVVDEPALINRDPYREGWLVKVRLSTPAETDALLSAEDYRRLAGQP